MKDESEMTDDELYHYVMEYRAKRKAQAGGESGQEEK